MDRLHSLYIVTKQIAEELNKLETADFDRAQLIQTVTTLIEQRETMLQEIKKPYTEEELQIGADIVQLNEQVKEKMTVLYEAVKSDMKQVQKKKEQTYSYLNPHGQIKTTDGMYMDSKL